MAWMLVNPQIHQIFASLGAQHGDVYNVSKDCLEILGDILGKLVVEDRSLRTFRRAIGFGQHIRRDLLPLLINVRDDTKITDASKIIDTTIKILVNLTIPVECLLSMDVLAKTDVGRHTIFEINNMLYSSKEAFVDSRSIRAVMDHMKFVMERGSNLEMEQCDSINNCLLLLRNILHIPEHRTQISNCPLAHSSMQNRILWNLFTQSIDKLLLHLMTFPQKIYWVVTMVQLIALMYKDQHVGTLQKLLNLWFEASLSESSDDNESNTSPPNQGSGDSSPLLTSDPTSDSSDNGSGKCNANNINSSRVINTSTDLSIKPHIVRSPQNRNKILLTSQMRLSDAESSTSSQTTDSKSGAISTSTSQSEDIVKKTDLTTVQSELSDYGYGTQVENQESFSTSSNEDDLPESKPIHQKPHMVQKPRYNIKNRSPTPQEKKEVRRKKLIKRSKTHIINMKGLMHHSPTDDDISNILKEFTVDFLLKGYGNLVQELYSQLLSNDQIQIDTSHFFWLVTYFLKFAAQLELDFEHIGSVLSFDIISYLTFEGVNLCEQLEINCRETSTDLKPCLRRMHLVVTAIREFFYAIETYKKITHLTPEDQNTLRQLQVQIASMENIKCLFVLLLRHYNPRLQSKQYLEDLVITNHMVLLFLETTSQLIATRRTQNMVDHLKQFATVEIMHQYGLLLENFDNNGKFVNDCIFTMMHHVGGDIDNVATLFQPVILKTFSKIWESDYEICDDWSDLIEYVIHKFINVPSQKIEANSNVAHEPLEKNSLPNITSPELKDDVIFVENVDILKRYYEQSCASEDVIGNMVKLYLQNGIKITRTDIITKLLQQEIINTGTYDKYMKNEDKKKSGEEQEDIEYRDIQMLKERLVKENKGKSILWLQKVLIEACHCKIVIDHKKSTNDDLEPVPYCYRRLNEAIPVVSWSLEHSDALKHESFILLLHKLGFLLPSETRKVFVRIPNFWAADYMYSIAQKLGPIDPATVKFDVNLLKSSERFEKSKGLDVRFENISKTSTSLQQYSSLENSTPNWFQTGLNPRVSALYAQDNSKEGQNITIPGFEPVPYDLPPLPLIQVVDVDSVTSEEVTSHREQFPGVPDDYEHTSICDTASVTSDLTRMYVSDEEVIDGL